MADTDGDGTITVTRPDGTVLCDDVTRCEADVDTGDQLVVTATPDPIADFAGFDGDCDVDATTCTTTHRDGHHVTATFHTPTVPITINVNYNHAWATTGWVTHDGETVCGYPTPDNRCTVQVPERAPATLRWGGQQNTDILPLVRRLQRHRPDLHHRPRRQPHHRRKLHRLPRLVGQPDHTPQHPGRSPHGDRPDPVRAHRPGEVSIPATTPGCRPPRGRPWER